MNSNDLLNPLMEPIMESIVEEEIALLEDITRKNETIPEVESVIELGENEVKITSRPVSEDTGMFLLDVSVGEVPIGEVSVPVVPAESLEIVENPDQSSPDIGTEEQNQEQSDEEDYEDDESDEELEELEPLPRMRMRNVFAQQDDLEEIKQMIMDAERPANYQRNRNRALYGSDISLLLVAQKHGHRLSTMDFADIPLNDKKSYVARRTVRTYDFSKRKAPPLPQPKPYVVLRNPPNARVRPEQLLGDILRIATAEDKTSRPSTVSIVDMDGTSRKGPYYQEPFEPATLPIRLPTPVTRIIDTTFFAFEEKPRRPPTVLRAKPKSAKRESSPAVPKLNNQPLQLPLDIKEPIVDRPAFIETAKPVTPRIIKELNNTKHVIPINPCFVNFYSKQHQKEPEKPDLIPQNVQVPAMALPSMKVSISTNQCSIYAGVESYARPPSSRTLFREAFHKLRPNTQETSTAIVVRKPKRPKSRVRPHTTTVALPFLEPSRLGIAGNRIST